MYKAAAEYAIKFADAGLCTFFRFKLNFIQGLNANIAGNARGKAGSTSTAISVKPGY